MTTLRKNRLARIDWLYAHRNMWDEELKILIKEMTRAGLYSRFTNWRDSALSLSRTLLPFVQDTSLREWNRIKTMMTASEIRKTFKLSNEELRTYRASSNEIIRIGKIQQIYDPVKVQAWIDSRCKHVPI